MTACKTTILLCLRELTFINWVSLVDYIEISCLNSWQRLICQFLAVKEGNPVICDNTDIPGGYYTKWNKPDRERQILYDFTCVESKQTRLIKT